jgi:hypothetical protein
MDGDSVLLIAGGVGIGKVKFLPGNGETVREPGKRLLVRPRKEELLRGHLEEGIPTLFLDPFFQGLSVEDTRKSP